MFHNYWLHLRDICCLRPGAFLLCILNKMAPPLLSPAPLGPRLVVGGAPAALPHWCPVSGQVEEHVARIREELDREREERNYFQLERDKIHTFWEITRRQLEEKKAELRNKDREMEEAEERHQVEIKVSGVGPSIPTGETVWVGVSCFSVGTYSCTLGTRGDFSKSPKEVAKVIWLCHLSPHWSPASTLLIKLARWGSARSILPCYTCTHLKQCAPLRRTTCPYDRGLS